MPDKEIKVTITGQDTGLAPALQHAQKEVEHFGLNVDAVSRLLERIGIATVVFQLTEMAGRALEAGASLAQLTQQTGLSAETLTGLQHAAALNGVTTEQLDGALRKLSSALSLGAVAGSKQADALAALGVRARDAQGQMLPLDAALGKIADRFQRMPDGANKTALAIQLFGKQGALLVGLLNQGSAGIAALEAEAKKLGVTLNDQDVAAMEDLRRTTIVLGEEATALMQKFLAGLAPALEKVAALLSDEVPGGMSLAEEAGHALAKVVEYLGIGFETVAFASEVFVATLEEIYNAVAHLDFAGFYDRMKGEIHSLVADYTQALAILTGDQPAPKLAKTGGEEDVTRRDRQAEKLAKERLAVELENLKLAAAYEKSFDAAREAYNKELYDHQLMSAAEYYDKRKALSEDALEAELYALQQEQTKLSEAEKSAPDEMARLEITKRIAQVSEQAAAKQMELNILQGKNAQGNVDALAKQAQAMERNAFLAQDMGHKIDAVYAELATQEQRLAFLVSTGQLGEMQRDQLLNALRDKARAQLKAMTADYQEFAKASGDPKLIDNAEKLNLKLAELARTADTLRDAARGAWESGLGNFFTNIADGSRSAAQAFLDLAKSMISAIEQVIAKVIALWIWQKIAGLAMGAASGAINVGAGASGGTGGVVPGGGNPGIGGMPSFGSAAPSGLPSMSSTMLVPSSMAIPTLAVPSSTRAMSGNSASSSSAGPAIVYNIDARGADAGVEQRILRAMAQMKSETEKSAVARVDDRRLRGM